MSFKILRRNPRRESPKMTISTNSKVRLLQMILELDIGRYANEDARTQLERGTKHLKISII